MIEPVDNSNVELNVGDRVESVANKLQGTILNIRKESSMRILEIEFDNGLKHERSDRTIRKVV